VKFFGGWTGTTGKSYIAECGLRNADSLPIENPVLLRIQIPQSAIRNPQ